MERKRDFDLILAEAVHESLSKISPSVSSVVIFYLKKDRTIKSETKIDDPQSFDEGLKRLFGFGAKVVEKKILETLYLRLELPQEIEDNFSFSNEVKKARKMSKNKAFIIVGNEDQTIES